MAANECLRAVAEYKRAISDDHSFEFVGGVLDTLEIVRKTVSATDDTSKKKLFQGDDGIRSRTIKECLRAITNYIRKSPYADIGYVSGVWNSFLAIQNATGVKLPRIEVIDIEMG